MSGPNWKKIRWKVRGPNIRCEGSPVAKFFDAEMAARATKCFNVCARADDSAMIADVIDAANIFVSAKDSNAANLEEYFKQLKDRLAAVN